MPQVKKGLYFNGVWVGTLGARFVGGDSVDDLMGDFKMTRWEVEYCLRDWIQNGCLKREPSLQNRRRLLGETRRVHRWLCQKGDTISHNLGLPVFCAYTCQLSQIWFATKPGFDTRIVEEQALRQYGRMLASASDIKGLVNEKVSPRYFWTDCLAPHPIFAERDSTAHFQQELKLLGFVPWTPR